MDFRNTIIVMTSNIASGQIMEMSQAGEFDEAVERVVREQRMAYFRPELLNRIDAVVIFRRLDREVLAQIVDIQIQQLAARLAEEGYDSVYGARPLRRVIQRQIENDLAGRILSGQVPERARIRIDAADQALEFQFQPVAGAGPTLKTGPRANRS